MRLQPVQASLQERAQRARQRRASGEAPLDLERHDLLREQRAAAAALGDPVAGGRRRIVPAQQLGDQLGGVRRLQGLDGHDLARGAGPGPRGHGVEELGPRADEHEDRPYRERAEVLDQVDEPLLGPVQVLERHHQRLGLGEPLEEPPDGPLDLLAGPAALRRADGGRDAIDDLLPARDVAERAHEPRLEIVADEVADDALQRERARALAVRQAATGRRPHLAAELGEELAHEPRLADPGLADEDRDARAALTPRRLDCQPQPLRARRRG